MVWMAAIPPHLKCHLPLHHLHCYYCHFQQMTAVTLLLKPAVLPLNLFDKAFHLEIICSEKMFEFSSYSHFVHCKFCTILVQKFCVQRVLRASKSFIAQHIGFVQRQRFCRSNPKVKEICQAPISVALLVCLRILSFFLTLGDSKFLTI